MSGEDEYPDGYAGPPAPPTNYSISYSGTYGSKQQPQPEPGALPPAPALYNVEAEAALLGALMFANDQIPLVAERLSVDDFFEPLHGRIFRAMVRMHERGVRATPVLLRPIFENDPDMKEVGGPAYLAMLTGSGAAVIGLRDFADQIAELSVRRKVDAAMRDAIAEIADPDVEDGIAAVDDIISRVSDTAYSAMARAEPMKPQSMAAMVKRVRIRQREIYEKGDPVGILCRSIPDLDKIIGPAESETLNVIGGRPGMLKTTTGMTAAWGYAVNNAPSLYLSGEMTGDQLAMRQAADLSHAMKTAIAHAKIRKGELTAAELQHLECVESAAEVIPLEFVSTGACDIKRAAAAVARAALRWQHRGRPLKIVWLDYLQKYRAFDHRGRPLPDTEAMNAVLGTILEWNKRFGLCTFALSQLGRQVEERKDKRPQQNDLKQSGNIEQDADSVTLLFREEFYLAKEKPKNKIAGDKEFDDWETAMRCVEGKLEMIGEKNRHGRPRTRTVKFIHSQYAIRGGDYSELDDPILTQGLFEEAEEDPWFGAGQR